MYQFYNKDREKQDSKPSKLPKSKQKFTAHATFHITRHPVGGKPLSASFPAAEHHLAASSWLPEGATKKLVETPPTSARDLKVQDPAAPPKKKKVARSKRKDGADSDSPSPSPSTTGFPGESPRHHREVWRRGHGR
eukprot:SRR837773.22768.p3 GENE.SRR837773.22768~~SRR837773.22768.p3  ORF type:complete len:146 (-),score=26.54 SRR837773.22768:18-425(-)